MDAPFPSRNAAVSTFPPITSTVYRVYIPFPFASQDQASCCLATVKTHPERLFRLHAVSVHFMHSLPSRLHVQLRQHKTILLKYLGMYFSVSSSCRHRLNSPASSAFPSTEKHPSLSSLIDNLTKAPTRPVWPPVINHCNQFAAAFSLAAHAPVHPCKQDR